MNAKALSIGGLFSVLLTGTGLITLSDSKNLREVEIIFYDKQGNDTKKVKVLIDSLGSRDYYKYYDNNSWQYITYHKNADDKKLYEFLGDIGVTFIKTQHNLNVIKFQNWDESNDTILKNNKCCCCEKDGQCQCTDGTQGKCCWMCLGCFSDNCKPNGDPKCCCCKKDGNCTWDTFKKNQKTFKNLMGNLNGSYLNTYLSPIQANIKFTDLDFNAIKTELKSNASQSNTEYKPFVGSLTYGFVDYWYRQTTYKTALDPSNGSSITNNSKDVYFSTVPQRFSFPHKKKKDENLTGDEAMKKTNLDAVWKKVENTSDLIKQYKDSSSLSCEDCCCCKKEQNDADAAMKCLLARNYVFLSKDTSSDIKVSDVIKNA